MKDILAWKVCTKCGKKKLVTEFFGNKKAKDGRFSSCKECDQEHLRKWRSENNEKVRAQGRRSYYRHQEDRIQRAMKWNKEHPEKSNAYIDRWHKEHPEKSREANRKSSAKHSDRKLAQLRKYRTEHPEKVLEWVENRRARKLNAGIVTAKEWQDLQEKYNYTCLWCKIPGKKLSMDHVVPLSLGGKHSIENLQPLCGSCNSRKSTKILDFRPKE